MRVPSEIKKWMVGVAIFISTSLVAWGIWVTTSLYGADKNQAVSKECVEAIKQDVKETKEDTKAIKQEIKEQNNKIERNQIELMKILLDIKKSSK